MKAIILILAVIILSGCLEGDDFYRDREELCMEKCTISCENRGMDYINSTINTAVAGQPCFDCICFDKLVWEEKTVWRNK